MKNKSRAEEWCDAQDMLGIEYEDSIRMLFLLGDAIPKKGKKEIIKELERRKKEKSLQTK